VPDILLPSRAGFLVTADATNVTVTNQTAGVLSVDVLAEHWHSLERAFGDAAVEDLVPQPFVVDLGASILNAASAVLGFGLGDFGQGASLAGDYLWPWYENDIQDEGNEQGFPIEIVAPRAGTLRNLYVLHNNPVGNGGVVIYTVFVNGAPTLLSTPLASNAAGPGSDLVNAIPVAQGDLISMRAIHPDVTSGALRITATMRFDA
jgi:hypothetical protein